VTPGRRLEPARDAACGHTARVPQASSVNSGVRPLPDALRACEFFGRRRERVVRRATQGAWREDKGVW